MTYTATVENGRLRLDVETGWPDGTVVELQPVDPGDEMDDAERAALHAALDASEADVQAGRLIDAADVLAALRAK